MCVVVVPTGRHRLTDHTTSLDPVDCPEISAMSERYPRFGILVIRAFSLTEVRLNVSVEVHLFTFIDYVRR